VSNIKKKRHPDSGNMKQKTPKISQILCSEDGSSYSFKVGESFFYEFHRHESVGIEAEFGIADTGIISHVNTEKEYLHPESMKPGWTGGDSQRGRWTFRADKKGNTSILIRKLFRGRLENECTIGITVT
jgi:hypothetical protein